MINLNCLQSSTALVMALGITATTAMQMTIASPTLAQTRVTQSQRYYDTRLPAGTNIPVTYDNAEKIVVTPQETSKLTLTVADDVLRNGAIVIPYGSKIEGQLEPSGRGTRFVARELILPEGRRQRINASSGVVTRTEQVSRGASLGNILTGAAVGSAAATLISGITGDRRIAPLEVLAGTGAGTLGGVLLGRRTANVVVVNPDTDLDLTLRSELLVSSSGSNSRDPNYDSGYDPGRYPRRTPNNDPGI